MTQTRFVLALSSLLVLGAAARPLLADNAAELAAFKAATRIQYDLREKAFNSKDPESVVDHFYTADAVSVAPGDDVSIGRQQLLAAFKAHLDIKVHIVSFKSHVNGTSGVDWTNFYYTPDDPKEKPGVLKMMFVWEKRAGKWVCIGDMWVPGQFPMPAAPK